ALASLCGVPAALLLSGTLLYFTGFMGIPKTVRFALFVFLSIPYVLLWPGALRLSTRAPLLATAEADLFTRFSIRTLLTASGLSACILMLGFNPLFAMLWVGLSMMCMAVSMAYGARLCGRMSDYPARRRMLIHAGLVFVPSVVITLVPMVIEGIMLTR